jgi:hypothetical protein
MTALDVASSIGNGGWFFFMMNRNCAGHATGRAKTKAASSAPRNRRPRTIGLSFENWKLGSGRVALALVRQRVVPSSGERWTSRQCHANPTISS